MLWLSPLILLPDVDAEWKHPEKLSRVLREWDQEFSEYKRGKTPLETRNSARDWLNAVDDVEPRLCAWRAKVSAVRWRKGWTTLTVESNIARGLKSKVSSYRTISVPMSEADANELVVKKRLNVDVQAFVKFERAGSLSPGGRQCFATWVSSEFSRGSIVAATRNTKHGFGSYIRVVSKRYRVRIGGEWIVVSRDK